MDVPKLRFKEFTDDWKSDKISNLTTYVDYRGKTPVKTETGTFLITAKNVKKGYIDYNCSKEYVEASQYNAIMHRGLPKVGDVLVTTEAPCGNVAQIDNANVALAQRIIKYRGNDLINNDFLKYELLSDYFQTELKRVASGGTVYGVKGSTLHQMSINYCSKEEQTKIAQFLSLLDKKIELQTKKIEALKLFKKGLINYLFSQNITMKIMVKDLGTIITGTTPSKENNFFWDNGNIPWITPSDITYERDISNSMVRLTEDGLLNGRYLPKDSILVTCIASIGKNAVLKVGGSCNQQINAIIPNEKFNYNYIYYLMEYMSNYMKSIAGTSATSIINKNDFEKLNVNVHSITEQMKIDKILSSIETKEKLEAQYLRNIIKLKTYLLQNMFV